MPPDEATRSATQSCTAKSMKKSDHIDPGELLVVEKDNDRRGWKSAVLDGPGELYAAWYMSPAGLERSGHSCADDGLSAVIAVEDPEWSKTRRRILVDLLEEYLNHTGHADVLREAIGGLRGNDPDELNAVEFGCVR